MKNDLPQIDQLLTQMRPFTEEIRWKTWWHTLTTLAVFCFFVMGSLYNVSGQPFLDLGVRFVSGALAGLTFVRMFILYHDYVHGAIFRGSTLGQPLMALIGALVLRPPAEWRRSHNFHHKHNAQFENSDTGSFKTMTVADYLKASRGEQRMYRVIRSPWVVVFGYVTCFLLEAVKKLFFREDRALQLQSAAALILHVGLATVVWIYFGFAGFLTAFLWPYLLSCCVGAALFYLQHNFKGVVLKPLQEWTFLEAALKSSSCLRTGPVTEWFTGSIGYHHIHHLNPKVPFYRLRETMEAVKPLQSPTEVRLRWSEIKYNFSLKLWDDSVGRMVGYPH